MLHHRRNSFKRAHALIEVLRSDQGNLPVLEQLQVLLIDEITRAEEKVVRASKAKLKSALTDESENRTREKRVCAFERRIDGFRKSAFVWRSFGDAIAFLYMDKFALKQCFYNTENINPRQTAGFSGVTRRGLHTNWRSCDSLSRIVSQPCLQT